MLLVVSLLCVFDLIKVHVSVSCVMMGQKSGIFRSGKPPDHVMLLPRSSSRVVHRVPNGWRIQLLSINRLAPCIEQPARICVYIRFPCTGTTNDEFILFFPRVQSNSDSSQSYRTVY